MSSGVQQRRAMAHAFNDSEERKTYSFPEQAAEMATPPYRLPAPARARAPNRNSPVRLNPRGGGVGQGADAKASGHAAPQNGQRSSSTRMWRAQPGQARRRAITVGASSVGMERQRKPRSSLAAASSPSHVGTLRSRVGALGTRRAHAEADGAAVWFRQAVDGGRKRRMKLAGLALLFVVACGGEVIAPLGESGQACFQDGGCEPA
jgi:hypothetical protein